MKKDIFLLFIALIFISTKKLNSTELTPEQAWKIREQNRLAWQAAYKEAQDLQIAELTGDVALVEKIKNSRQCRKVGYSGWALEKGGCYY